jgi:hypothetical protein
MNTLFIISSKQMPKTGKLMHFTRDFPLRLYYKENTKGSAGSICLYLRRIIKDKRLTPGLT